MVLYSKIKKLFNKEEDAKKDGVDKKEEKVFGKASEKIMEEIKDEKVEKEPKEKEAVKTPSQEKENDKIISNSNNSIANKILIKPLISEKASILADDNKYCFEVYEKANKSEVKKAIFLAYGIKPLKVNIINMSGKNVRFGRRFGKRKNWKKAIIILPKGQKLEVYEGV